MIKQYELRTGKIVRVINGEQIPADIVIILTSSETNTCYIDTASIDGETSLKIRRAPQLERPPSWMQEAAPKDERALHGRLGQLAGFVECDLPNEKISVFNGNLELEGYDRVPISKDHVVLRGSSLHTDWLLGIVVYTGSETKLALNARTPPQKLARLDKICNGVVLAIFSCQIALAIFTALLRQRFEDVEFKNLWYVGYWDKHKEQAPYLKNERWPDLETKSAPMEFFWSFCTFLILYCNLIPLSLYISLELAFVMLVNFVNWDVKMYHSKTDTPALARSPTITDLGQVQYVFSDKTGTLTRNEMKLRRLIVHGVVYGVGEDSGAGGILTPRRDLSLISHALQDIPPPPLKTIDSLVKHAVDVGDEFAAIILESLMLCNTVVVETKPGGFKYQAESPDEGALVEGGAVAGYTLCARTEHIICGTTPVSGGKRRTWHILATNDFDNDRKRMSIFLREQDDSDNVPQCSGGDIDTKYRSLEGAKALRGRVILLCKGADNAMLSRAAPSNNGLDALRRILDAFASEGLRTLVFGIRVFTEDEYLQWHSSHYSPAVSAMHNRDVLLRRAASEAEQHLTIIGASAIEDKLQDGVPETIATLSDAGIKLWVLTGDKRETAIEIGKSCRLVRPDMPLAMLSSSSTVVELQACLRALYQATADLGKDTELLASRKVNAIQRDNKSATIPTERCFTWDEDAQRRLLYTDIEASSGILPLVKRALVIDGEAMQKLFGDPAIEAMLFSVLAACDAVIACRVTPKQKAQLVLLVHEHVVPTPVTLAIGDGANDVNMIMSAQVGVGISGHEGLQAVNADWRRRSFH
jgi:phospholipid-translocating P-type ATPase (flippase)